MANGVEIIIEAQDNASSVINNIGSSFDALGAIGTGVLQGIGQAMFDLAMNAIPAVVDGMKELVSAASEAQEVEAKFDAIIKGSPLAGYSDQLKQLATDYSQLTRFEDEQILAAETVLLQFQNISKEAMPDVVATVLDVAEVMGTDAPNAARVLGRALEDPFNAARSLRQMNIILSEEQEKQMKLWEETGDKASASGFVMDLLKNKIGNVAEEMGDTFAGQMTKFQNTIGNIKEELGGQLLPVLTPIVEKFGELALQYAPLLAEAFNKILPFVTQLADALINLLSGGAIPLGEFQAGFDALANWWAINSPMIMEFINGLWTSLSGFLADVGAKIGPLLVDKFNAFVAWLIVNAPLIQEYLALIGENFKLLLGVVSVVVDTLAPLISGIFDIVLELVTLIMQVATGDWAGAWETIKSIVSIAATAIIVALGAFFDGILKMMGSSGAEFVSVWYSNFLQLVEIVGQVGSILRQKVQMFIEIGRSFISGLIQGVQSMIGSMISTVVGAAQGAVNAVKSVLKIKSPSQVFADIGSNIMAGMAQGITGNQGLPSDALIGASNALIPSVGGGAGGGVVNFTYAPAFGTADPAQIEQLSPIITNIVRRAYIGGQLGG